MKKFLLSTLVLVLTALSLFAQVTTSSLTGTIKDSKETLIGATVKATHQPTGTVYATTTRADGRYTIANMRVGGPYLIEVSYVGYEPQKFENISISLGEPSVLNVTLTQAGTVLREVSVTAANPNSILNADKNGASTNISRAQIQTLPTISRSVNDITRLTPQANGTAIGGGNYRQNNFSVDGSNFNNQFGIGQNVPAQGSPISLDALEQISINVTPYDVRQSGFIGGAINAVTRSGTNKFFGSAFYLFRSERQQGDKIGSFTIPTLAPLDQKQYGFSFGGPLIKNKLFFFVNGEFSKRVATGQMKTAATPAVPFGSNTNVARPTAAQLDMIKNYLVNTYNYDPGIYQGYDNETLNDKLLARLDWNITKNHQFSLRYNQVESEEPFFVSTSTTGMGLPANYPQNRQSNQALHFSNSNYTQQANLYSVAAEVNSSFGKFTNNLRGSWTHQNDPRGSKSSTFPFVDILEGGNPLTSFGYEPFTFGNLRDVETYTVTDNFGISAGKHNLTLGVQADFSTTKNGFQRFGTSAYSFNSWNDFVSGAKPQAFAITYSLSPGYAQAYPTFKFAQYSAYLQDEFTFSDRFKLTAGLRAEQFAFPSVPEIKSHPIISSLTFANNEKVDTGTLPEAKILFSPRLGFNWDVKGDRSLQVRGGSGIFVGRVPFVWIVAQSGDAGLLQVTQSYTGTANTPGPFNPNPRAYLPATPPAAGTVVPTGGISALDPDFKSPQVWKSSLAFDVKLPLGIVGTLEGIYNKNYNTAVARNANLIDPTPLNVAGYPDNRVIYPSNHTRYQNYRFTSGGVPSATGTTGFNAIVLDNAKGGHSWYLTAQLNKQFGRGLSAMVAYTRSEGKTLGDGAGDQLANLWSIPPTTGNPNNATTGFTTNIIPNRVIASLNYRKEFLKNLATTVSFFYEGAAQGRFSYLYGGDLNRDNAGTNNDLIYIPRDASEIDFSGNVVIGSGSSAVTYTPAQQKDLFFAYIEQDKYLRERKGQYAERNGALLPWRNQVDFRFAQEIFKNIGTTRNSFQFTADIFNLGNLLNKNWGEVNFVNNSAILVPQNQNTLVANGTTRPTFRLATANGDVLRTSFGTAQTISSTYYMQFGFRYNFQ